ncbi:MAG: VOC family protein [Alphaproteobacteria bacterium]|nr:VOC family protein [Alphaproteobacteria bacterium]
MLKPKNFEHIGIVVSDMDRALRFYASHGLEVLRRRGEGRDAFAAVRLADAEMANAEMANAEMNVFCNPDRAYADDVQRVDHVCLCMNAATIDDLLVELRDAGIAVASGPVKRSDGFAVFVRDPDGLRIELLVKH